MMSRAAASTAENRRIDSWKEIAAFFGRDERTVKRWEKERGLPVHRLPGERGGVFAWSHELTSWLNSSGNVKADSPPPPAATAPPTIPASAPVPEAAPLTAPPRHRALIWTTAAAAVLIAVALGGSIRQ